MVLVDANVLLHAVNEDADHHVVARRWLDGALVGGAHLAALAVERDATVVTFDREFGRFVGVRHQVPG